MFSGETVVRPHPSSVQAAVATGEPTMQPSDEDLIHRFRSGDESAFEAVVERWNPVVLRLAFRLTGDLEEARDVRQMALLKTYDALEGFRGSARFSTWLYRIVLNLCRDGRRGSIARERALRGVAVNGARVNGHAPSPATLSEERETGLRVAAAVTSLPAPEREVVVLRHYHDLAFPRIAEVLGAPVTTVKSRMKKGLELLRVRLKDLQA